MDRTTQAWDGTILPGWLYMYWLSGMLDALRPMTRSGGDFWRWLCVYDTSRSTCMIFTTWEIKGAEF